MFSHVSAILFRGGGGSQVPSGGEYAWSQVPSGGGLCQCIPLPPGSYIPLLKLYPLKGTSPEKKRPQKVHPLEGTPSRAHI